MPHIHNQPDQHDMTVSAYIVRMVEGEWECLVHYHNKIDALMQVGGHVELNETPWQAMAHELEEESGYQLDELHVLQFTVDAVTGYDNVAHPTPFSMNTHLVGNEHYHSDMCFGFIAAAKPKANVAAGEADDLRWMSLQELKNGADEGIVLKDVAAIYAFLITHMSEYTPVPAQDFSVEKPKIAGATYKRGAPGVL